MEQQQFRIKWSVGTKLLISVVLLLFIAITFLDLSTIFLIERDKRAYTYQAQSTEAVLIGREFINTTKHVLDTLRLSLATVDLSKGVADTEKKRLQSLIDNQTGISFMQVGFFDPAAGELRILGTLEKENNGLQVAISDLVIEPTLLKDNSAELVKKGIAFFNSTVVGKQPLVSIVFADRSQTTAADSKIPVSIGFISLRDMLKDLSSSHISLVNQEGWVLFDTDPAALYAKKNISDYPLYEAGVSSPVASGTREYEYDGKRFLGSYVRPGYDLFVLSRTDWRKAMSATYTLTEKSILLGIMAISAAVLFALIFAKTLTAPLKALYEATKAVATGNFNVQLDIRNSDELGALSSSFTAMSKQISELIEEKVRKVYLENELAIASTVQQTLIPPTHFQNESIEIRSHYQSANECGGDWWGFFGVGRRMCFMIADATGHGLPSALITASARSCFSVMHKLAQEDPEFTYSPGAMLAYANRVIHDAASSKIMMTFFVGTVDFDEKKLIYASAGHNPPWLFKKTGDSFVLKSLMASGQRLGEARDVPSYEEKTVDIAEGDMLFLYTDGLMEGKNPTEEQYGKKRVKKQVESTLARGAEVSIRELMVQFLIHNTDQKPLDDDVTIAIARFIKLGPQEVTQ